MSDASIKIPAELFATAESSHFDGVLELAELAAGPDTYRFEEPIRWSVEVTNTGDAFLVEGSAEAVAMVECSRCLDSVPWGFEGEIEGFFLLEGGEACPEEDEDALGADGFDTLPDSHIIDLAPLIKAALLVDAPVMPLCDADCKGLCPVCGANLNHERCSCGEPADAEEFNRVANPFAALANYEFSEN